MKRYGHPMYARRKHLGAAISSLLVAVLVAAPVLARAEVYPIEKDAPAPITGLLLDEKTFMRYADQQVALASCRVEKGAALTQVETLAQEKARAPSSLVPSSGYFWLGVGAGIVATVLAVFGAAQLVKASSK